MRLKAALVAGCVCGHALVLSPALWSSAWAAKGRIGKTEEKQTGDAITELPGQTHQVQTGDTLWDLTARYLNNPWYWPKVWSYNPQLTNPHYIYPGQLVRFYHGGPDEAPSRIEASTQRDVPQDQGSEPPLEPPSKLTLSDDKPRGESVSVSGNRPLVYSSGRGAVVQNIQLVTSKELQEAGEIVNAVDDKALLSTYDIVFLRYKKNAQKPSAGQPLIIYETVQEVEHPVTGRDYGYLTHIMGTAEVLASGSDDELITVRITKTYDAIERGQLVAAQKGPLVGELIETPNSTKLKGYVLTGEWRTRSLLGQFHYVFVDRGTKDGVVNGNNFVVIKDGDIFHDRDDPDPIPPQVIGKLVVIDAKETASLAVVTQSLRDITPGDKIEMR